MKRYSRKLMKLSMLAGLCGGILPASTCSVRDLRDAILSGGISFLEGTVQDSLKVLLPLPEVLEDLGE